MVLTAAEVEGKTRHLWIHDRSKKIALNSEAQKKHWCSHADDPKAISGLAGVHDSCNDPVEPYESPFRNDDGDGEEEGVAEDEDGEVLLRGVACWRELIRAYMPYDFLVTYSWLAPLAVESMNKNQNN